MVTNLNILEEVKKNAADWITQLSQVPRAAYHGDGVCTPIWPRRLVRCQPQRLLTWTAECETWTHAGLDLTWVPI